MLNHSVNMQIKAFDSYVHGFFMALFALLINDITIYDLHNHSLWCVHSLAFYINIQQRMQNDCH